MEKVTIVGQMNGQILYKAVANLSNKESLSGRIPVGQFPSGLLQISLFNLNNEPLCERTIFVNNEEYSWMQHLKWILLDSVKRKKMYLK